MTTIITTGGALGDHRCDARCHNAANRICRCVCNGRYHGAAKKNGGIPAQLAATEEEFCTRLKADGSNEALALLTAIRQAQANARQIPLNLDQADD